MSKSITQVLFDRRILYLILILIIFIGPTLPVVVPLPVEPWVQDYYNTVQAIKPGQVVLVLWGFAIKADQYDAAPLAMEHLMRKGANIIWVDWSVQAIPLGEELRQTLWGKDWKANPTGSLQGKVYGTTFTYMGYLSEAGTTEEGLVGLLQNFPLTMPTDFYGTPDAQLSTVSKVQNINNINALVSLGAIGDVQSHTIEICNGHGVPMLMTGNSGALAGRGMALYVAKQFAGLVGGERNIAEYALLVSLPSLAQGYMVTMIILAVVLIITIIGRNVWLSVVMHESKLPAGANEEAKAR